MKLNLSLCKLCGLGAKNGSSRKFFLSAAVAASGAIWTPLPPQDAEFLEPSIQNEVDHAVSRADAALAAETASTSRTDGVCATLPIATNGLDKAEMAIRLVSCQRADGRWFSGTNDVTRTVLELLRSL